jgi:hypothetical protein
LYCLSQLARQLADSGVHNMTVSWQREVRWSRAGWSG